MRELIKNALNAVVRPIGARMVGAEWGPRGFAVAFKRMKAQGFTPRVVIDVGASDGRWSRECQAVFRDSHYALFDPLAENASALAAFTNEAAGSHFWSGALGPEEGKLALNVHGHQSSFFNSEEFKGAPVTVEVRPLDSFIEPMEFKGPMLLKADVQGYELEVLKGAPRCLEITEAVMLEVSFRRLYEGCPLAHDVIAAMGGWGYRIYDICAYSQRPRDGELAQADVIFVKSSSALFAVEGWN